MSYIAQANQVRKIQQGDPNFDVQDGFALFPRAMIQITPECPLDYRLAITRAMNNGWIKTVAHVTDQELVWETLGQ